MTPLSHDGSALNEDREAVAKQEMEGERLSTADDASAARQPFSAPMIKPAMK
jgi:hypothetical protein